MINMNKWVVSNCQEKKIPPEEWFRNLLDSAIQYLGSIKDVSIAIVGEERMVELNKEFLGKDEPTDVIAFPLDDDEGEVVVSMDEAEKNARILGAKPEDELALYIIHGILHLSGYDDLCEKGRKEMIEAEKEILKRVGIFPRKRY